MSKLIRISESDDWIVDYDRERGMYRVSYFEDYHFKDEHWFDAFEEREVDTRNVPYPVKRWEHWDGKTWSADICPNCGKVLSYNFGDNDVENNRKQYCYQCGQLCDFEIYDWMNVIK